MNQQQALEVKDLAKDTVEALEMIGERECSECDGEKYILVNRPSHTPPQSIISPKGLYTKPREWRRLGDFDKKPCSECFGTGKMRWQWKPEVNQTVLYDKKLMFIVSVSKTRLSLLPFGIPDFGEPLDDYVCTPEIIDVVPILEWEDIERVLEGVGYNVAVIVNPREHIPENHFCCAIKRLSQSAALISECVSSRQEAVMKAVIALGKKLGEERKHV